MPEQPSRLGLHTTRVGILGWPVAHSRSPAMHNAAHAALGLDAHYHLVPTAPDRLAETVRALVRLGWTGVNVTIPHKVEVLSCCDEVTAEAARIGAVNLLTVQAGRVLGDNTDAPGFVAALRHDAGWQPGGQALVLGTGGSARAVVAGLAGLGVTVVVAGRRREAAAALAALARDCGADGTAVDVGDASALADAVAGSGVVANATPLGMRGERLPDPLHHLAAGQVAVDLVYAPDQTPFLADAARAGATCQDGRGMLVHQAALGFRLWHGVDAPVAVLAAAASG